MTEIKAPAKIRFLSYMGDRQGCGTIRIMYPSMLLNLYRDKKSYKFEADYLTTFVNDPNFYKSYTFVQFQRSASDTHLKLFNHYLQHFRKQSKVPILYEIDDLLYDIPEWNYASSYYNPNTAPIFEMMRLVDGMTVSTEVLKEEYGQYCDNIVVIPNHLPKFIWGDVRPKHLRHPRSLKDKPRLGWAGSENHFCNPLSTEYKRGIRGGDFSNKIIDFIKKTTDKYTWVISGALPVELHDVKDKIEFHPWVNIFSYPNYFKSLDLDIGMALLMPCRFNDAKSNIKCLEYTVSGIPGVYSNAKPYENMTLTSNDDDVIISHLEKLASDIDFRKEVFEKDYEIVKDQLFWENNDNLRKFVNSYLSLFGKKLEE